MLTSGIMHACHTHGVQYILAGSIRDDGPLPETMMDLVAAQDAYGKALDGVEVVVMLSSMLHSIGVGNMLPSWVKVICVDINPAVVTKLSDRGSTQTIGIVTDVGLFLHQLAEQLKQTELMSSQDPDRSVDARAASSAIPTGSSSTAVSISPIPKRAKSSIAKATFPARATRISIGISPARRPARTAGIRCPTRT